MLSENSRINISAGIHALTKSEIETAYKEITGIQWTMKDARNILSTSNMQTAAVGAGKTMSTKAYDLFGIGMFYWVGGTSYSNSSLWLVRADGTVDYNSNLSFGVRTVVSLNSGVQIASSNTGDGSSVGLAYTLGAEVEHNWNEGTVTQDSTCTAEGIKTYTCNDCGKTRTETIAVKEHTPGAEATCTRAQVCTVCNTELAPATGHTEDSGTVTKEPTCVAEGTKTFKCTVCNEVLRTEPIEKDSNNHVGGTKEEYEKIDAENHKVNTICLGCSAVISTNTVSHNWKVLSSTNCMVTYECENCKETKEATIETLSDVAAIGDYVNYDPTSGENATAENTTYTSVKGSTESHGNGQGTYTFSAQNYKNSDGKWRILDIDENGFITLISDLIYQDSGTGMATTGVTFSDGVGYIWAEEEIHRIAAIYGHGKGADTSKTITYYYGGPNDQDGSIPAGTVEAQQGRKATMDLDSGARGLTVEDINKICGRTYDKNYSAGTITKDSVNANYYPTIIDPLDTLTGQSQLQTTFSGSYYNTYKIYDISAVNSDINVQDKQNEMLKLDKEYFLASRGISGSSTIVGFLIQCVNVKNAVSTRDVCDIHNGGTWLKQTYTNPIRAVVTLQTGIKTSDAAYPGDETGWTLGEVVDHNWNSGTVSQDSTCTVGGIKTYTCNDCGITKTETIAAKGHTPGAEATCTEAQVCTVCSAELAPALDHTEDSGTVTIEPTCITEGTRTFKCTVCSEVLRTETISVKEHEFNVQDPSETYLASEATCTAKATYYYKCANCNEKGTETYEYGELKEHTWDEGVIHKAETCIDENTITYTCSVCSETKTEPYEVSATGTSLKDVASIGDYVNYDPTTGGNVTAENTKYTSMPGSTTEHGNGNTSKSNGQTFTAANYKNAGGKWRILDIDGNGNITLISDPIYRDNDAGTAMLSTSDENGLYISNGIGYIWAEEELNRISAIYGHGEGADTSKTITYYYGGPNDQDGTIEAGTVEAQQGRKTTIDLDSGARALTIEDINKICGKDTKYTANYSSSTVAKESNNAKYYPTINTTNTTTGQSAAQTAFSGNYYYTSYGYTISSANKDTTAQTEQNNMLNPGVNYWLGSRSIYVYPEKISFFVRTIYSDAIISETGIYYCINGGVGSSNYSRAVRAVVHLEYGIQTSDEAYNESTGWTLESGVQHNWDEGTVTQEPTCTVGGINTYTCNDCGITKTETIAVKGHIPGAEATCTEAQVCTVCNTELAPATGHNSVYAGEEKVHRKCSTCGVTLVVDHTTFTPTVITEATCTKAGVTKYTCTCGYYYTKDEPAAKGHTPGAEATCTTPQVCTVCNAELAPALGHNWEFESTTNNAENTTGCITIYKCKNCNETKEEITQITSLSEKANIGDYVNYDPTSGGNATTENTTYTSMPGSTTEHGNGYTDDADGQTFSASNYKNAGGKWRILDIDDSGNITLISDLIYQDSGTTMGKRELYLSGGLGYIWAEEELNRISAIYGHGAGADTSKTITYYYGGPNDQDGSIIPGTVEAQQGRKTTIDLDSGARALTVEDINKICGQDTTYTTNYSKSTAAKNSLNATYYPTLNTTNITTGQSAAQTTFSGNYYYTNYVYTFSSANSDSAAQTKQNEMIKLGANYWLGSRCVSTSSTTEYFGVRTVDYNNDISRIYTCYTNSGSWDNLNTCMAVRAVVTLQSGIQTSDATYDSTKGWTIVEHNWDEGQVTQEPTCKTEGTIVFTCTQEGCSETRTESIATLIHSYNNGQTTKEPTCTVEGEKICTCTKCGEVSNVKIAVTAHISVYAGEEKVHRKCGVCGIALVTEHSGFTATVITEATCTKAGVTKYTCSCGYYYTKDEPAATGHTPGAEATCTEAQKCIVCNTELVAAKGHTEDSGSVTLEPTCVAEGTKTFKCTVCGEILRTETIAALDHNWEFESTTNNAENTTGCITIYKCKVCNETKEETTQTTSLSEKANIGDYVNYDPTSGGNATSANTTYKSVAGSTTAHGNGYGSQTFSASNYKNAGKKWRILDIDSSGNITLISDLIYQDSGTTMGTTGLYLQGGLGYIWAEEELNRISAIYGHGAGADTSKTITYYYGGPNDQDGSITPGTVEAQQGRKATMDLDSGARALTAKDIDKICGKDTIYTANYSSSTVTKNSDNAKYYPTLSGTSTTGQSAAQTTFSGNYYKTHYTYTISSKNSDTTAKTKQNEMIKDAKVHYWLGSRWVGGTATYNYFYVSIVESGVYFGYSPMCKIDSAGWTKYSRSWPVRAVVNLQSGIQTSDATYDSTKGWTIVEHSWNEGQVTQEPTCETEGTIVFTCTQEGCSETRTESIATLIHSYNNGQTTKEPTCTAEGVKTYTCTKCGETSTEAIQATGHSYTSKVTTAATCAKAGVRTYTCTKCSASYTEQIAATGAHTWNSGTVTTASTCTSTGVKTYTCSVCKGTKTETIAKDANNHTGGTSTQYENASATQHTVKTICSGCSVVIGTNLQNHAWNEGTVTTQPTTTAEGAKNYTCTSSGCGATKTEAIPKLGLVDVAAIGDYVNYDPTSGGNVTSSNTTYTSVKGSTESHGNGYGTYKVSAEMYKNSGGKWRILDKDENGTIILISDLIYRESSSNPGTLSKGISLSDGVGYIWAEEEIHRIAAIFGHGYGADTSKTITYYYGGPNDQDGSIPAGTVEAQQGRKATLDLDSGARGLTVDDINEICGKPYLKNYQVGTFAKTSTTANYYPTIINPLDTLTGQSQLQTSFSGSYYITTFNYTISSVNSDTNAQTKQNEMLKLNTGYFLASRSISGTSTVAHFYIQGVWDNNKVYVDDVCDVYNGGKWLKQTYSKPIRAVVTLQNGIGTNDTSYPGDEAGWSLAD